MQKRVGSLHRNTEQFAKDLIQLAVLSQRMKLEFCRRAAWLALARKSEGLSVASTVEWMCLHCRIPEVDAVDCLVIGYAIMKDKARATESDAS